MRSIACVALASLIGLTMPAYCQSAPNDRISLSVTRAELQIIGQGLMELPYKTSSQVLADLQSQINAADQAVAKTAADAKAKAEEKPADTQTEPAKIPPAK